MERKALKQRGWLYLWGVLSCVLVACGATTPLTRPTSNAIPVADVFRDFYEQHEGGITLGAPLTTDFVDPATGYVWQYFEHMRLEHDGQKVLVTALGEWAWAGVVTPMAVPTTTSGQKVMIGEIVIQDQFLSFYRTGKRAQLLGAPISAQIDEGGLQVQYFVNGRLEWHPAAPVNDRVQMGDLGRAHYLASGTHALYEQIIQAQPANAATVADVVIDSQVQSPILYAGDEQMIFVTVYALDGRPVPELTILLTVQVEGQEAQLVRLGQTNELGQLQGPIPIMNPEPGKKVSILIRAYSATDIVVGSSTASFKLWW